MMKTSIRGKPIGKRFFFHETKGLATTKTETRQIHTKISLSNAREAGLEPLEVEALVDTGAAMLCLPDHVAGQLRLAVLEQREVTIADGRKR